MKERDIPFAAPSPAAPAGTPEQAGELPAGIASVVPVGGSTGRPTGDATGTPAGTGSPLPTPAAKRPAGDATDDHTGTPAAAPATTGDASSVLRLTDPALVSQYLRGGRGRFTLVSRRTGVRFTFKVTQLSKNKRMGTNHDPKFIRVLTGSDNESSYSFLGTFWFREGSFLWHHDKRRRISIRAASAKAIRYLFQHLNNNNLPDGLEFWHEGVCCKCGRALTVPESIAAGIGPTCAGM